MVIPNKVFKKPSNFNKPITKLGHRTQSEDLSFHYS